MPDFSECTLDDLTDAIRSKIKAMSVVVQDKEGNFTFWQEGNLQTINWMLDLAKRTNIEKFVEVDNDTDE